MLLGKLVGGGVPYFTLKNIPDNNNLKTLGAALASSGSVALYHMENVTPEYDVAAKVKLMIILQSLKTTF